METEPTCILYGSLLRPLAYADADRLVVLQTSRRDEVYPTASMPDLNDVRDASRELEEVGTWRPWQVTLTPPDGQPTRALAASVDSSFFALLGMTPALGRGFSPDDDLPGHEPVVILSHSFWRSHYGSGPGGCGKRCPFFAPSTDEPSLSASRVDAVEKVRRGFRNPARTPPAVRGGCGHESRRRRGTCRSR